MFLLLYCKEIAETIAIMRMAREAISSAVPQGLALTLGIGGMVVVVDVLMVRVGEGKTDEKLLMRINLIFFLPSKNWHV